MKTIKGINIAEDILNNLKKQIRFCKDKPCLAVILIGKNEASQIYVKLKEAASKRVGIKFKKLLFDEKISENKIINKIKELNADSKVSGIIVQLPLPKNLNREKIINSIIPEKDVDGFHQKNQNLFLENKKSVFPVFPKAILRMIDSVLDKKNNNCLKAVVICQSNIFGKIMKKALNDRGFKAEFVFCKDLRSKDKKNKYSRIVLKRADIVISVCGVLNLIKRAMIKNGAIIIDGGIIKKNDGVFGDVEITSFKNTSCKISSVPGGVGPVTVATLLENVYLASKNNIGAEGGTRTLKP